ARGQRDTNDIASYDQFHAPVELTSSSGVVCRNGHGFSKPSCAQRSDGNALLGQEISNEHRTPLRQLLVQRVTANAIGVTFGLESQTGVCQHDAGNTGEFLSRQWF